MIRATNGRATQLVGLDSPVRNKVAISHHDTIKWFEAIPENNCVFRVKGTQVNGACNLWKILAPGTSTPMQSMRKMKFLHPEGDVTFSIDGDVFKPPSAQLWFSSRRTITLEE